MYDMNPLTNTVVPSKDSQTLPQPSGTFQSDSQLKYLLKTLRNGTSKPFNRRIVESFGLSETFHVHDLPNRKINIEKLATQRLRFNGNTRTNQHLTFQTSQPNVQAGTPKAYHGHRQPPNATPAL